MFGLFKVRGDSMLPTLEDGDIVLTIKPRTPRAGFIYVCNHSDLGRIIKRAKAIDDKGRLRLQGDNPASTPPAVMGKVETSRVTGRAVIAVGKTGLRKL